MAVQIEVEFSKTFASPRSASSTYDYFANLENAVRNNFVGLASFQKVSGDTYRWEFESVKHSGYEFQVCFTTRFENSADHIKIHPVSAKGESQMRGAWTVKTAGDKSQVHFHVNLTLELPLPFFAKGIAQPIVQKEIAKLFDRYVHNVENALST